jgi:long-subunit fatty acid transport protein
MLGSSNLRGLLVLVVAAALTVALVVGTPVARAGGMQRPNVNGARAVGMAGAYVAVADDALSIYHNPAGLARMRTADFVLGAELVFIISEYTPPGGSAEKARVAPNPLPFLAGGARILVGKNSFLALGVGIYNSFGGSVKFKKSEVTEGIIETQIGLFEFTPTVAYQVHKRVFIGLGLRMGLGFFSAFKSCGERMVCVHDPPMDPTFDTASRSCPSIGWASASPTAPAWT